MILDASIFSRAVKFLDAADIKLITSKEEKEITIGRLTSLDGKLIPYENVKVRNAPQRFPEGKVMRIEKEINSVYSQISVPAGATFKDVIEETSKTGLFPVLFPLYLNGTVGGFVATNGSGFGSYRFGFNNYKKAVHSMENDTVYMLAGKYKEVIETDSENSYAWSGIIREDGSISYYSPAFYSSLLPQDGGRTYETFQLIKEIHESASKVVKRDYVPFLLRVSIERLSTVRSALNAEYRAGYIINYNSPSKFGVLLGAVEESRIPEILSFLKDNPDVYPWPSLQNYEEIHKQIIKRVKKAEVRVPKRLAGMREEFLEGMRCVNCGICLDSCTAFKVTNNAMYSPPGRFALMLTSENADYCFGCKECEEACPVGIPISTITETLPKYNKEFEKLTVDTPKASYEAKQLVTELEKKYKNRPIFLLFTGCSTKYDPLGLKGFLGFLLTSEGKLPSGMSPRVYLMDGDCCGFGDYQAGNEEEAKKYVEKIKTLKTQLGAQGVYFLCPEGLYVYNKLSGDRGVLAYDLLKGGLNQDDVHAGCWAKKLGVQGKYGECAGTMAMTYKGKSFPISMKSYMTICPFSTWKFGTVSVYSKFVVKDLDAQALSNRTFNDTDLVNVIIDAINKSLLNAADEIAGKVYFWRSGGPQYFTLISASLAKKYFYKSLFENITKNKDLKETIKEVITNKDLFREKINSISELISHQDFNSLVTELQRKILESPNLEYSMSDIVNSKEFADAINKITKSIVSPNIIMDAIAEAAFL